MMNVAQMIKELEKMGFKVDARKRTDGSWIIKKINDMSFTGASGNQYARQVLGVELSQARIEQTSYNVAKYIKLEKGQHKAKEQIDKDMVLQLRKVQRQWRKQQVKARITKKKLRWHIKEGGTAEAKRYLERMERYGKGLAYEENVEALASWLDDFSKSISDTELSQGIRDLAALLRERKDTVKQQTLQKIHDYFYEVRDGDYKNEDVIQALMKSMQAINE